MEKFKTYEYKITNDFFSTIFYLDDLFLFSNDVSGWWECWSERRVGSKIQGHWFKPLDSIKKKEQEKVRSNKWSDIIFIRDSCSNWPWFSYHKFQVHLGSSSCVHCLWHNSWEALLVSAVYGFWFCLFSSCFFIFMFFFSLLSRWLRLNTRLKGFQTQVISLVRELVLIPIPCLRVKEMGFG